TNPFARCLKAFRRPLIYVADVNSIQRPLGVRALLLEPQ
ncbi:MAG: hypothetical protein ACI89J_003918, partial [Hyphomicrobiaceae bacterium]